MDPKLVTDKRGRRFLPKKRYRYNLPGRSPSSNNTNRPRATAKPCVTTSMESVSFQPVPRVSVLTTLSPSSPGYSVCASFHARFNRSNQHLIVKCSRLARRGGVIRISAGVYAEVRVAIKARLTEILRQVVHIMDSSTTPRHERKVVTTRDVVFALNRMGQTIYGFDTT
ncbi:histone H4 [Aspergillus ibericus CBS 121593]|uniref:Histone H4 n=1 Tax=Aspergillus ibericus CBS 121593 TaxID=1448316 RepID=A0A395H242_9EURO|nr:hypothetical protein BO80DRAFT_445233 [Aspergillus ibericus CBS 121593]RAL00918.1 hypothetical protein BO80DRAFT_445233 [Aspergillus ibericus CBS 121593]